MSIRRVGRARTAVLAAVITLAGAGVQGISNPFTTRAQTQQYSGQVVNICGTVTAVTPSTTSAAGSITVRTNSILFTYGIPANLTFSGLGVGAVGQNICISGVVNGANQLLTALTRSDVQQSTSVCGTIGPYVPATATSLGSLTITNTVNSQTNNMLFTIAYGTSLGGVAIATGSSLCLAMTLNGLGQITAGSAAANSGTTTSSTPVEGCGTVTAFTAPTGAAAGSIAFDFGNGVTPTYVLAAGSTFSSPQSVAVGQTLCIVGAKDAANTFSSSLLLTSNFTTSVVVCGALSGYQSATNTTLGIVSLGSTTLPIAYGIHPTGDILGLEQPTCITGTLNGLGQLTSLAVQVVVLPTDTPTGTPTATGTATAVPTSTSVFVTSTPPPPPPATSTSTATATSPPTATAPPTNTPVPPAPVSAHIASSSASPTDVRIGGRETISVKAAHGVQRVEVHVIFATGFQLSFKSHTDKKGKWRTTFAVPKDTISRYSREAVVTVQVFKNHTTDRDYQTFFVSR